MASNTELVHALKAHQVSAQVIDCDHYRIRGGLAVETDYIVRVKSTVDCSNRSNNSKDCLFKTFTISKTYSAFRTLAQQLKEAGKAYGKNKNNNKDSDIALEKFCNLVFQLIDAQRTSYLGKVNYMYVKILAKQRRQILNDVLAATCHYFPNDTSGTLSNEVANILETFFLTDHVETKEEDEHQQDASQREPQQSKNKSKSSNNNNATPTPIDTTGNDNDNNNTNNNAGLNPLAWIAPQQQQKHRNSVTSSISSGGGGSVVVPMTRRRRRSMTQREQDEHELQKVGEEARLLVDDDRSNAVMMAHYNKQRLPNYSRPVPTVRSAGTFLGNLLETNPLIFFLIACAAIGLLQASATHVVSMDGDVFLLVIFACFCLGLHTPRPMVGGFDQARDIKIAVDKSGRRLLRRSMIGSMPSSRRQSLIGSTITPSRRRSSAASKRGSFFSPEGIAALFSPQQEEQLLSPNDALEAVEESDDEEILGALSSPLPMFPEGAEIGSQFNCWSCPDPSEFLVRGPKYLSDKKKFPSQEYLFPARGLDLFLTDTCPSNCGRNPGVMGGQLRSTPTFIINFRLPWGVLLFYAEIPFKFLPYIEATTNEQKQTLSSQLNDLSPSERTVARWLMSDSKTKNKTLKIVPVVVDGPWVVRSVVGGKPALIGEKLPINYVQQPAQGNKALYLEADLDIAASSAARGILSVARSYTNVLTLNLGFVIQANQQDELPEQMLMGARLHGIDPLTAAAFPPMDDDLAMLAASPTDDESV